MDGLAQYMKQVGAKNVSELVGTELPKLVATDELDRKTVVFPKPFLPHRMTSSNEEKSNVLSANTLKLCILSFNIFIIVSVFYQLFHHINRIVLSDRFNLTQ